MTLRDRILATASAPTVEGPIAVPEWGAGGAEVYVRVLSGAERDAFELSTVGNARNVRARLVVACACDAAGALLFQSGDVEAVGALDGRALDRIFSAARELNLLGADYVEALKKS